MPLWHLRSVIIGDGHNEMLEYLKLFHINVSFLYCFRYVISDMQYFSLEENGANGEPQWVRRLLLHRLYKFPWQHVPMTFNLVSKTVRKTSRLHLRVDFEEEGNVPNCPGSHKYVQLYNCGFIPLENPQRKWNTINCTLSRANEQPANEYFIEQNSKE